MHDRISQEDDARQNTGQGSEQMCGVGDVVLSVVHVVKNVHGDGEGEGSGEQ